MLTWLFFSVLALAGEPVAWADLDTTLDAVWQQGAGAAWATRSDGAMQARQAVPTGVHSVFAQLEPDPRSGSNALEGTQVALQVNLGRQRAFERARWAADAQGALAQGAADRLLFGEQVRQAWLDGWVGLEMAEHLDGFAEELGVLLDSQREAAAQGLIAPSALADLEVEVARLRQEASNARVQSADAQAYLSSLLGRAVEVDDAGMPDLEADLPAVSDPWPAVAQVLDAHPELQALRAAGEQARAAAREASASPVFAGAGASLRARNDGSTYGVPLVLLQIPLANPRAPEVRQLRAEAAAIDQERSWALQRLQASVLAASDAWSAAVSRVETLQERTEAPLRARLERLEGALAVGATDTVPLILAVRDLHEAHHAHALAVADLVGRRARAEALLRLLSRSAP